MVEKNKNIVLILSIVVFLAFILILLLGLGTYAFDEYYYYYNWYQSGYNEEINGIAIGAIISLVGLIYSMILKINFHKLKNKKLFLVTNGIIVFLVFSASILSLIFKFNNMRNLFRITYTFFPTIMIILCFVIAIVSAFLTVKYAMFSTKYITPRKEKKLKEQSIENAYARLKTLKSLLDSGAITQEEFDEKRRAYIDLI